MRPRPEYRNRDETEVAVLDVLAECNGDGMTILAIRAEVDADIDTLEAALANLKADGLIGTTTEDGQIVIRVEHHAIAPADIESSENLLEELRQRFPL